MWEIWIYTHIIGGSVFDFVNCQVTVLLLQKLLLKEPVVLHHFLKSYWTEAADTHTCIQHPFLGCNEGEIA